MTHEDMLTVAEKVRVALHAAGLDDLIIEAHDPGDPIPIMFSTDGELFILELMPA